MHALGQGGAREGLADGVVADVGEVGEGGEEAERVEGRGVDADAHADVPALHALQRRARGEGAFGDDRHRQPPALARVADIGAELADGAPNCGGWKVGCGHLRRLRGSYGNEYVARTRH